MFCISVPVKSNIGFLARTLASLRAQQAACAVALLDASGDPAVPAIADASELDFSWRRHRPDAGQASAIAEGWARAPGDILGWLNDDDILLPGALDAVAAIFATEPDTDIVYGHGVMLDEDGAFVGYFPSISEEPAELRARNVICQPAAFVRRRAVERIGGLDTTLHYTMDWDLWLRLHETGARFRFVDEPLAAVRNHAATKTRSGGAVRRREVERLMAARLTRYARWRLRLGIALSEARDNRQWLVAGVLQTMFAVGRAVRPARPPGRPVLGLDPTTSRVEGRCSIVMPVDSTEPAADLLLYADRTVVLSALANGVRLAVSREKAAGRYVWRLHEVPLCDGVLRCDLSSAGGAWRLRRAVPCAPAGALT